jgi:hypothetical protein
MVVVTLEPPEFLDKAQMALVVIQREARLVMEAAALQVAAEGHPITYLSVEAQSELFGPVVQEHSHQHERQMSSKYEPLY